jgi:HicB family
MRIEPYVESIGHQFEVAADAGGDEARALAQRLVAPLESAIRLAVQDALSAAAEEITVELAPGSVELRLRGRDPEFVVTPPPRDPSDEYVEGSTTPAEGWATTEAQRTNEDEDGTISRINLRLPEYLKARIERAADAAGLSINSWLVRAAAGAVERADPPRRPARHTAHGAQRYTGWVR